MAATREGACSFAGMVSSGCASSCNSSEIAAPIRARPKSRAKIRFIYLSFRAESRNPVAKPWGNIAGSFDFAQDDGRSSLLQFGRNFANQVLDPFSFVSVTDQQCILRSHDNEIMDSKQRNICAVFLENDVIAGFECGNGAVRSISVFVFLKVIGHCSPTSDVVSVEAGLYHKDAIGLFHDRVIE